MLSLRYTMAAVLSLLVSVSAWAQSALYSVGTPDTLYSNILGESRTLYVDMPLGYEPGSDKKYPVAFVLDGELLLPALAVVQDYYSGGFTPEMVLIGIANDHDRVRDLTPTQVNTLYGMPFEEESGQADRFLEFIAEELVPYVEEYYPVTDYRTLIGHSYGGLFAVHALLTQPELFANYVAIDPSLDWDNRALVSAAEALQPGDLYEGKSLFVSLNGQLHMADPTVTIENVAEDTSPATEFARANVSMRDVLMTYEAHGLAMDWAFYPTDLHGTIPLPSLRDGLIALFAWYQMENIHRFNDFETPTEELKAIIEHRADKLARKFGYFEPAFPEELMTVMGYMTMEMDQPDKAKMFFEQAVKQYPNSANVYDSLADYYEAQEDYDRALALVTKAYEISGDPYHAERIKTLQDKE